MDRLSQLPEELIDEICSYLTKRENLQCLRMCSKTLEEKSRHAFYDRHLGIVRAMITRGSLRRLIDLTKEERFQKAIRELEIVSVSFDNSTKGAIHGNPITQEEEKELQDILTENNLRASKSIRLEGIAHCPLPVPRHPQVAAFERGLRRRRRILHDQQLHDQNTIRTMSADVELLAEALRGLPALKTIRSVTQLDTKHPPLDARQLFNGMGIWPSSNSSLEVQVARTHGIAVIFGAMLESGCQLETIDLGGAPSTLPLAKTPTSRKFSRTSTPAKTFAQSQIDEVNWAKLRHLSLKFSGVVVEPTAKVIQPPPFEWILPFVTRMSSLRSLTLAGSGVLFGSNILHNLVLPEISLPQLHILRLTYCGFELGDLKKLLDTCRKTLKTFVCVHCWGLNRDHMQTVWLLVDLPSLIYAELLMKWPRLYPSQQHVIDEKTPADFQKRLNNLLHIPV